MNRRQALIPTLVTLADAEERYMESLALHSPKTHDTYATGIRAFNRFLQAHGGEPGEMRPAELGPDVLEDFLSWLLKAQARPKVTTLTTYMAAVRELLRFLVRRRLAPDLNVEAMQYGVRRMLGRTKYHPKRVDKRLPLVVARVLAATEPDASRHAGSTRLDLLRDRALLLVLFSSGMRRTEAANLNRSDVEEGYASEALITGKGDKERVVFFDADTLAAIRAYLEARNDQCEPLFLRHDNRRGDPGPKGEHWRLSPQSVWYQVRGRAAAQGIEASPHHFRHAKASLLLNRGASLSEVQDILGHASPETTKRVYAHYDRATLRSAFQRYSASVGELVGALEPEGA